MPNNRQIYLLDPQKLAPETIAVSFAKTSRSPQSFKEIAAELSEESSSKFHEKWVVGYGHSSVAEHAVLHIAIENVSRLAVETIQANRLASFTEKSTRYQKWNNDQIFVPAELDNSPLRKQYLQTCEKLLSTYDISLEQTQQHLEKTHPYRKDESAEMRQRRIRSECTDVCRFLLPACSMANVGVTINARSLEYAIVKMLSSPLIEVRDIGEDIKKAALSCVPTLVKYADKSPYLEDIEESIQAEFLSQEETNLDRENDRLDTDWLQIHNLNPMMEEQILSAILFRFSKLSYAKCAESVTKFNTEQRSKLIHAVAHRTNKFQIPLRELEYSNFSFNAIIDQGAYYELKRHRMMTQTAQPLSACHGYAVPQLITDAGLTAGYHQAMQLAERTYFDLVNDYPQVASYIIPNGFNRQIFFTMNLRNAIHLITLRTAPNAHFSIRRLAFRMAEEISKQLPSFGKHLTPHIDETWQDIESQYFSQIH